MFWEIVGYISSFLVLISLLMTSVVKFRVINGIGSAIFCVYALVIGTYPTAIMNFCLVIINLVFLIRVLKNKAMFSVVQMEADSAGALHFAEFFRQDICKFFPEYDPKQPQACCYMVYADANPVGILMGTPTDANTLTVTLDYAAPSHRDCSVGTFLYEKLRQMGFCSLQTQTATPAHSAYLKKMGFSKAGDLYIKKL